MLSLVDCLVFAKPPSSQTSSSAAAIFAHRKSAYFDFKRHSSRRKRILDKSKTDMYQKERSRWQQQQPQTQDKTWYTLVAWISQKIKTVILHYWDIEHSSWTIVGRKANKYSVLCRASFCQSISSFSLSSLLLPANDCSEKKSLCLRHRQTKMLTPQMSN